MLQQTQVVTVIPYFDRFLRAYPTLARLARADEQDVLKLWEGLGYYRRARDLLRAAQLLAEKKYDTIPNDVEVVQTLPGFGRYTTNAVLSQAYDCALPILEANSQRVLCRLFGVAGSPKETSVRNQLWRLAEDLLPRKGAGDFNQALMELGALVCTASKPRCGDCPLRKRCEARKQNRQEELPARSRPAPVEAVAEIAAVIRRAGEVLLVQRAGEGRWARLWEFPRLALASGESEMAAFERLLASLGVAGALAEEIATIRHSVTRFRITLACRAVDYRHGEISGAHSSHAWVRLADLGDYPLSAPQRRLARRLQQLSCNLVIQEPRT